jgi:hypothetical protein
MNRFCPLAALALAAATSVGLAQVQPGGSMPPMQPPPIPQQQARPGAIVLRAATLIDRGMNNMPSHTVLVPGGWQATGGAYWPAVQAYAIAPSQEITVAGPDGSRVYVGPALTAGDYFPAPQAGQQRPQEGSVANGLPILAMPANLDEWRVFLERKALPANYKDAQNIRVESVTVIPAFTQLLRPALDAARQQYAQSDAQAQQFGMASRTQVDGAVLGARCTYTINGRPFEDLLVFGTAYVINDSQLGRQVLWGVDPNISFRAPAGTLDAQLPLMMTVAKSCQPTQQWSAMRAEHLAKMANIALKGAADRSAIVSQSAREVNAIITRGFDERQANTDRVYRDVSNSFRGVDDYTVPGSGASVQLPNNYSYVYSNGNGTYVLTNDAGYNPNADPNSGSNTWTQMQPAR